jgi:multiple sugar transport system ATP-binding protein
MGRAIVREPSVFLMDEPLSNLDAKLRVQMRAEVLRIQRRLGVATMYVTHDQTEAMTMGDRVAVMQLDVLQQCDNPQVLYDNPANLFVATFIGSPAMNLYEVSMQVEGTGATLILGSQRLVLTPTALAARPALASYSGKKLVLGIRPEYITDPSFEGEQPPEGQRLTADVELVEALGSELLVHFNIDAPRVRGEDATSEDAAALSSGSAGEVVAAAMAEGVARVDPRSKMKVGSKALFAVDVERLHYFDRDSGLAI